MAAFAEAAGATFWFVATGSRLKAGLYCVPAAVADTARPRRASSIGCRLARPTCSKQAIVRPAHRYASRARPISLQYQIPVIGSARRCVSPDRSRVICKCAVDTVPRVHVCERYSRRIISQSPRGMQCGREQQFCRVGSRFLPSRLPRVAQHAVRLRGSHLLGCSCCSRLW